MKINKYNEQFFDVIDSELKAYLLGYLVADGCITIEHRKEKPNHPIRRVQFQPSIDDLQVITLMRDSIAPDNKITTVLSKRENRKDTVKLRLANTYMVKVLMNNYNICPRKTYDKTFRFPTMDKQFRRHFIRGYMDGDGSFGNRHFSMICNSVLFLGDILSEFKDAIPDLKHYVYEENRSVTTYYSLHFSVNKKSRLDLFNYLYKDCQYKLDRKFNKAWNTVLNSKSKELLSV